MGNNKSDTPTTVTAEMIKAVRKETRAGALDCKHALEMTGGDIDGAIKYLVQHGKCTPKTNWI